jgi:hypothetical protein
MKSPEDIYRVPAAVLFLLGAYDLLRGFMHTFLLRWSAAHFAGFDMATVPEDQLFLLGAFGVSNFLTGLTFLLISWKARHLSPHILILIPLTYLIGWIGIRVGGVHSQAEFYGRYLMFAYFAVCLVTFAYFLVRRGKRTRSNPPSPSDMKR